MRLLTREEVIKELIDNLDEIKKFENNKELRTRIKNGPSQLASFGLLPYITFLVSKYDRGGYREFLNILIYSLNKLNILNIEIVEDLSMEDKEMIKKFLEWIGGLDDIQMKILERNLRIIIEEMKKIYVPFIKE